MGKGMERQSGRVAIPRFRRTSRKEGLHPEVRGMDNARFSAIRHPPSPILRSYHLVGVGGVGMSALAQVLLDGGASVSGSDRSADAGRPAESLEPLRLAGMRLVPQDGAGVGPGVSAVVISSAIEADNADLAAARTRGVPVLHRAECLAALANRHGCVAVTGTAGKTTVVGMIGWMLAELGADPTVVNGGALVQWMGPGRVGSVRMGRGPLWVVEADESDRSLMCFFPDWAVITNASRDHFALDEVRRLFAAFAGQARRGVIGLGGTDDLEAIREQSEPELLADGARFRYRGTEFRICLPGRHNVDNALLTVMLGERLGYPLTAMARALAGFRGLRRRLELAGRCGGVTVYDDYAHNPAKIAAAWTAVAPHHERMLAVWRPHGYGPLALLFDELVQTFSRLAREQDRLFLLPVYYAGGRAERRATSEALAAALRDRGTACELAADYEALHARLAAEARAGDAVLWMGARDPELSVQARRLAGALRPS